MTETEALNDLLLAANGMLTAEDDPIDEFIARTDMFRELVRNIESARDSLWKEATTPATNDWRDVVRDLFLAGDYNRAMAMMMSEAIRVVLPAGATPTMCTQDDAGRLWIRIEGAMGSTPVYWQWIEGRKWVWSSP